MKTTASTRKGKQARTLRSAVLISLTFLLCGLSTWSARAQSAGDWPVIVNDVDFNSAELRWPSANAALCGGTGTTTYTLRYRMAESGNWNSATTTGTTYALTGLESGAVYEVWLSGTCGANSLNYDHATFSTASTWKETPGGHLIFDSPNARIGIGTSNPVARLHVGGSLLAEGNTCPTPASGAGTRLMWVPSKAAFRAGEVTGTAWDSTNLGDHSLGFGFDAEASGTNAIALGRQALATGQDAAAIGQAANAGAPNAFALGFGAAATDNNAFALGKNAAASDNNAFALGRNASASGPHAFALGQNAAASENNAFALGNGASASDNNAFALGKNAAATGNNAFAIGKNAEASGKESYAVGAGAEASGEHTIVIGAGTKSALDNTVVIGAEAGGAYLELNDHQLVFRRGDGTGFWYWNADEANLPGAPEDCGLESRTYGSLRLATQELQEGECGGYLCAEKDVSTAEYFQTNKGLKFQDVGCQKTAVAGTPKFTLAREGNTLVGGQFGAPPRLELYNGGGASIATFTTDQMTGLGVASLSDFDAAKYRLYVEGLTTAYTPDARAIYASGSVLIEREVAGPNTESFRNVVAGTNDYDIQTTKAIIVDGKVNGVSAENFVVTGSGAVTANEQLTINKEAVGGYGFGILANITGTSAANRKKTKAFAVRNNGTEKLSIWGNGRIICDERIIAKRLTATLDHSTLIPDYVFADDYELRPLSEVEAYVNEHSHLPGVPNAAEIKAKGLDLAQMNLILLEKVEELTLYSIELEKRVKALEGEGNEE